MKPFDSQPLDEAVARGLGLDEAAGVPLHVLLTGRDATHRAEAALDLSSSRWVRLDEISSARTGLRLEARPGAGCSQVRLATVDGAPLAFRAFPPGRPSLTVVPKHDAEAEGELRPGEALLIQRASGRSSLILVSREGGLLHVGTHANADDAALLDVAERHDDLDLVTWLREALDAEGPLRRAVAVGRLLRLQPMRPSIDWAALVATGDVPTPVPGLDRWWETLVPVEAKKLSAAACEEANALRARARELDHQLALDDPMWARQVLEVVRGRERLACVLQALGARPGAAVLGRRLAAIDRSLRPFLLSLPIDVGVCDEPLLRRVAAEQPDAWWTLPLRGIEGLDRA